MFCPVKLVQVCLSAGKARKCGFLPLWMNCEARGRLFMCQERSRKMFSHLCGSVKLVQACLSAEKARKKNFHHSGGPVQACLGTCKVLKTSTVVETA